MKTRLFCLSALVLFACNNKETPPEGESELVKEVTIPVNFKTTSNTRDTLLEKTTAVPENQVNEIYVEKWSGDKIILGPNQTKHYALKFTNNAQYTCQAVAIGSLSGDGSAEIMTSLTPVVDGNTTLYFHNPHNYGWGCTFNITFIVFFRKNY